MSETERQMVQRHVDEGSDRVATQRRIVAELERDGHPAKMAHDLLAVLLRTQELSKDHLCRLQNSPE